MATRSNSAPTSSSVITTTVYISNIHCGTCTSLIETTLQSLSPHIISHKANIMQAAVPVEHTSELDPRQIVSALFYAGFEIYACETRTGNGLSEEVSIPNKRGYWLDHVVSPPTRPRTSRSSHGGGAGGAVTGLRKKRKSHIEQCKSCQELEKKEKMMSMLSEGSNVFSAMGGGDNNNEKADLADLEGVTVGNHGAEDMTDLWNASLSIQGMTCSSCVNTIRTALGELPYIDKMEISALTHGGNIVFRGKEHAPAIVENIEDLGYDAELLELNPHSEDDFKSTERTMALRVDGLHCPSCPPRVLEVFEKYSASQLTVISQLTEKNPIVKFRYTPQPDITTRKIIDEIRAVDPSFTVSVHHVESVEERSALVHKAEMKRIGIRLILSVIVAIPTFIIGVVLMSLLKRDHPLRIWIEEDMWIGQVSRAEWATFILATPVYFFAADLFHVRAIAELRGLWSRKNPKRVWMKFVKFGSMNLLMSLGTTIAYFASLALLAIDATTKRNKKSPMHGKEEEMTKHNETFFDAVVFLTMFLLIGRLLESYSKGKSANAVSLLGNLRPTEAYLIVNGNGNDKDNSNPNSVTTEKVAVELLEIGDKVVVPRGQSPPSDGKVAIGESKFDESSLTGESRLVDKKPGAEVYAGTINQGGPVTVEITNFTGKTILDQIVQIVRDGQGQRAPIERIADLITGYFVPVVSYLAVLTWIIWLALGYSGSLSDDWLGMGSQGGWAIWSMKFAISVFVIACPCGIGLAAPTALFVGTGLAAKYGILVKGGGEAFQEASWLDCIVFDKTGTLTEGGEPSVTDTRYFVDKEDDALVTAVLHQLESASGHPLAKAVVAFCANKNTATDLRRESIEELPGRGMKGTFTLDGRIIHAVVGNEALMEETGVFIDGSTSETLEEWQGQSKSVILAGITDTSGHFRLSAVLAAADTIRTESAGVISELKYMGLSVWMISGDNPITARSVAATVGIPPENVIAGVLPHQKAEKVQYLQQTAPLRRRRGITRFFHKAKRRPTVAMVGDGINDAPALATADVGIAIGSGSDIALGSASFILVRSNLLQVLTLLELSRKVFTRVKFNFFWAAVYNIIGIPVAAGVFYWSNKTGLDPAFAALAMACSSVSVVCSSLLLKTRLWGVGFKGRKVE